MKNRRQWLKAVDEEIEEVELGTNAPFTATLCRIDDILIGNGEPCIRCPSYMAFGPCGCLSGDGALDMRLALLRILIEEDNEVFE